MSIHAQKNSGHRTWGSSPVGRGCDRYSPEHDARDRGRVLAVGVRRSHRADAPDVDDLPVHTGGGLSPVLFIRNRAACPLGWFACGGARSGGPRRLGRSHAWLSRLNLCRAVTRRGSAKSNFIEPGLSHPKAKPAHHQLRSYAVGFNAHRHSERQLEPCSPIRGIEYPR